MNLLKKWRKHDQNGRERRFAKRETRRDLPIDRFRDEMNRTFDRVWRDFDRDPWSALATLPDTLGTMSDWPAIDMAEDDKAVTLRVDVPGLDLKDVDVEVSGNLLTIRGQREDEWSDNRKGVYRRERRSGSFVRSVTLPNYVEPDKIEASYDKGILTVMVPKAAGKGPMRVEVKS
jgi:HSP20 family protein